MIKKALPSLSIISITSLLCLSYLMLLFIIDYVLLVNPVFLLSFYLICGAVDLLVIFFSVKQLSRNRALLLLTVGLLALLPLALSEVLANPPHIIGDAGRTEFILLRIFPLLLLGLILLVSEHSFIFVLFYCGVVIVFMILVNNNRTVFGGSGLRPFGFLVFVYTITFLITASYINHLVKKLKRKNKDLADFAAMREELVVSRERNRIARELHDTLAHSLTALSVQLETAKAYQKVEPASAEAIIDNSLDVTRKGLKETRQALKALRASPLEDLGLILALREMLEEKAELANLELKLVLPERLPVIPQSVEQCLYRIIQEASENTAHHANANMLDVELRIRENIELCIKDDGQGFNMANDYTPGHYGLKGMKERAVIAGGSLSIQSAPGEGCESKLVIEDWKK